MKTSPPPDFRPGDDPHNWFKEAASCVLVSPLLHFAEWLGKQPAPVRGIVADEVASFLPDDALYRELEEINNPADRLLAFCTQTDASSPTLRRVFIIRAAVDLLAFQHRATADDWCLHAVEMTKLEALAEANGDQTAMGILRLATTAAIVKSHGGFIHF